MPNVLRLQSHHYGIEITGQSAGNLERPNSNRTIMELKSRKFQVEEVARMYSNRTIMELKYARNPVAEPTKTYSNRTIMELKC